MAVGKEKIIELKNITKTYDNGFMDSPQYQTLICTLSAVNLSRFWVLPAAARRQLCA